MSLRVRPDAGDSTREMRSPLLQRLEQAWRLRWCSILSSAATRAFAASLLDFRGRDDREKCHFGSSHFGSRGVGICFVSFASVRPRSAMSRGGWVFNEELSRALWQQMLRGPRPPSVQWPSQRNEAKKHVSSGPQPGQIRRWRGDQKQPVVREVKNPDEDAAALQGRIKKLEKAIEVFGADNPEAQGLVSALKKARAQSHSQSAIGVRLDSCRAFVERAKKRLAGAEEAVTKALCLKSTMEAELEQGLARLQSLREEAAAQDELSRSTGSRARTVFPDSGQRRVRAGASSISGGTTLLREYDQC